MAYAALKNILRSALEVFYSTEAMTQIIAYASENGVSAVEAAKWVTAKAGEVASHATNKAVVTVTLSSSQRAMAAKRSDETVAVRQRLENSALARRTERTCYSPTRRL